MRAASTILAESQHGSVRDLEQAADERGTGFVGQCDGMLGRQLVATGRRVVGHERSRGLRIEPFAGVVLIGAGAFGQFGRRARPVVGQAAVVAETVTHHDQGAVQYGADLFDRFEDKGHQLFRVDRRCGSGVVHEVSFLDTVTVAARVRPTESGDPPGNSLLRSINAGRSRTRTAADRDAGRRRAGAAKWRAGHLG